MLGVRLSFQIKDLDKLKAEYLAQRAAARDATISGSNGERIKIALWPGSLTDFLERRLRSHLELLSYPLDPNAVILPNNDSFTTPQILPVGVLPFDI